MKMPTYLPKIRKGQIWRKKHWKDNAIEKSLKEEVRLIITAKAKGGWRTVRYENRKVQHFIRQKDLYLFFELESKRGVKQSHNI